MHRVVPRHARERHGLAVRDRLEHLHHGLQVDRAVLGVDQQPVEPDRGEVLGEERAAGREPHSEGRLALSPELFHSIGAHGDDSSGALRFGIGSERAARS